MSKPALRLEYQCAQDMNVAPDPREHLQARATLAEIYDMESRLRRDEFSKIAACLAIARMELLNLIRKSKIYFY